MTIPATPTTRGAREAPFSCPESRECDACGVAKPITEFYVHKSGTVYRRCKPCHYKRTREWRAQNMDTIRRNERRRYHSGGAERKRAEKRLRKYGITQDQFDAIVERQEGLCPICLEPLPDPAGLSSGAWNIPSVDHCHETGAIRGVLHRRCNLAIEFLLTHEEIDRAREYLAKEYVK